MQSTRAREQQARKGAAACNVFGRPVSAFVGWNDFLIIEATTSGKDGWTSVLHVGGEKLVNFSALGKDRKVSHSSSVGSRNQVSVR